MGSSASEGASMNGWTIGDTVRAPRSLVCSTWTGCVITVTLPTAQVVFPENEPPQWAGRLWTFGIGELVPAKAQA